MLSVSKPGTVWFSLVSLFPPTYHDRVDGNRIDLMEKLAAMKPAFLRFPGGNYLEGGPHQRALRLEEDHRPSVDRPDPPEPLALPIQRRHGPARVPGVVRGPEMQPLLAVYAGYSLQQELGKPGPDLEPYVQDALDEIEYVTGDADTNGARSG